LSNGVTNEESMSILINDSHKKNIPQTLVKCVRLSHAWMCLQKQSKINKSQRKRHHQWYADT